MCDSKSRTFTDTLISTAIAAKPATTALRVIMGSNKTPYMQSVALFVVIIQYVEAVL